MALDYTGNTEPWEALMETWGQGLHNGLQLEPWICVWPTLLRMSLPMTAEFFR